MRWVAKAGVQRVLSALPRSETWNYVFQRHVTRNLPRKWPQFVWHAEEAARHWRHYVARPDVVPPAEASLYEFGAGWDLVGPVAFWALGAERQTLVDIRPNLRLELVDDTIARLARDHERLEAELALEL